VRHEISNEGQATQMVVGRPRPLQHHPGRPRPRWPYHLRLRARRPKAR
jgi:hypothetical protein